MRLPSSLITPATDPLEQSAAGFAPNACASPGAHVAEVGHAITAPVATGVLLCTANVRIGALSPSPSEKRTADTACVPVALLETHSPPAGTVGGAGTEPA